MKVPFKFFTLLIFAKFMTLGVASQAQTPNKNEFGLVYQGAISQNKPGEITIHAVKYMLNGIEIAANVYTPAGYVPVAAQQRSPYGAGHGSDISFVFNTLNARWGGPREASPAEVELAIIMNNYWVNFAKTGNPNGKGLPLWPLYNLQSQEILDVELDGKINTKSDPRKARLDVVEKGMRNRGKIQSRGI
jgi:hypothetical protein